MKDKSHYLDSLGGVPDLVATSLAAVPDVASQAPGLIPPPLLDWENWRAMVRDLKAERGVSINAIAERSGLDRSTVIELLNGRRQVKSFRVDTLWSLAWALGVTPKEFPAFISPLVVPYDGGGRGDPDEARPAV
ncbi:hypothetical protein BACT_0299 [Bifidobacterium actinocoloniiforme DSM 22766]|uniref:HTH cro/C1-type domain-containing protein n=1 Tax=Bifidobacterium actinocoloniiforme DSM 22766 TaxID=1437605 RepID=A0A086YVU3_9BIFI|nr:helix-turn-helix transcriptional regulator [Bifidobacterium actinocoloniiforme]AKV54951.1 hypothetical protein AB656_00140 [Bifidobacterium actinocoloniiforme DSM 22766]KFI38393.1 hypothetical protein BACT_0299 [Bifidobacterium actinocoloniiforme DSM 22766]